MEVIYNILNKIICENTELNLIIDDIVNCFKQNTISDSDQILLNLIFSQNPNQEETDNFFKNWDIEAEGGHKSLLLSYFMKMHPYIKILPYAEPRLRGLLNFYRFHNIKLISHFKKICDSLTKAKIDVMVIKGGAMKHLRPEYSRVMGDIDILVRKRDFKKAKRIVREIGYTYEEFSHSIDLHQGNSNEGILDIHHKIDMLSGNGNKISDNLFERAKRTNVFGVENVYVPCNEDLFFIALVNLSKNLFLKHSSTGILYTLFDSKYLIDSEPNFNWDIVKQNAIKTKTETQIFLAIKFINKIVPNLLPDKIKYSHMFDKNFKNDIVLIFYNKRFLADMREISHTMKINNIFQHFDSFIEYIKFRPKYFLYTRKMIRKNPTLAKKVLVYQKQHLCK